MNEKEKQIVEELSEFLFSVDGTSYKGGPIRVGNYAALALALYDKGYRKQSAGEWIRVAAFNDGVLNTVKCSACGVYQPLGCWDYHSYCPRCGAKMGGGAE